MTDKGKIRAEIEKLMKRYDSEYDLDETEVKAAKGNVCHEILCFIDSLPKESVSEDLEEVVEEIVEPTILNAYGTKELARRLRNTICGTSVSDDLEDAVEKYAYELFPSVGVANTETELAFKAGAKWQKAKDESITEDLGKCINELSKQFPEVSFAKLSRIAVRVAKWQKEQMMAEAIDGEVVATSDNGWESIRFYKKEHHCGQKVKVIVIKEE